MPITVHCGCDRTFEVDDGQGGQHVACEACGREIPIPTPSKPGATVTKVRVVLDPAADAEGSPQPRLSVWEVSDPADPVPRLVPCGVCKRDVAVEAETCPHCGNDLPRKWFNSGTPYVTCGQCLATNSFLEGCGSTEKCRACGASLEAPYREKERVLRLRNEAWGLCLLGVAFGGLVGYAMGGAGGAVSGGLLAGMVGGWVGFIRYWLLTQVS